MQRERTRQRELQKQREMEDDDLDVEDEEEEEEVEDNLEDDEEEEDDEINSEDEEDEEHAAPLHHPRLKIKLKLPPQGGSVSNSHTDDDNDVRSTPSTTPGPSSGRPMTTRQAVLASVVDSTHVSLNEGSRNKKKQLNESELALRREETARKRKNLSEKKLEDEKVETINRLLKKQSRPKNKRTLTADDRTPSASTPGTANNPNATGDVPMDEESDAPRSSTPPPPTEATMYRWVSTSRGAPALDPSAMVLDGEEAEGPKMHITFSIPISVISEATLESQGPPSAPTAQIQGCAVKGCGEMRKYRLVRDWTLGACGMEHLKVLEGR